MADRNDGGDDVTDVEFTPTERKRLRRIMRDEDRMRWFYSTLRIWGAYMAAVVAFIWYGWDTISKAIRALTHAFTGG